jgi:hypothetical protein
LSFSTVVVNVWRSPSRILLEDGLAMASRQEAKFVLGRG